MTQQTPDLWNVVTSESELTILYTSKEPASAYLQIYSPPCAGEAEE